MEHKELTEEQTEKLKKLRNREMLAAALTGLKYGLFMFLGTVLVGVINSLYVHSQPFAFVGVFITSIATFKMMESETDARHVRVAEEIKKILDSDS